MLSLNDREWKEFIFDDIFIVQRGEAKIYKQDLENGYIPYVSASFQNNGITLYSSKSNRQGNMLSLAYDGSIGSTYYQSSKWFASEKVVSLTLKNYNLNKYLAYFLCRTIEHQKSKYSYAYKWSVGIRMMRGKFMLPINEQRQPDYDFMESYAREQEELKKQEYLDYAKGKVAEIKYKEIPALNEKEWIEYFLKDLFSKIQRGKRLTKENQSVGNKPYVSSTAMNNGVDNFIGNKSSVRVFSNCLSIANSGSVGSSFYEPFEFIASDHVTHFKNSRMNMYHYLFIATMTSRLSEKYNFNREINDIRISKEKIMLPTNEQGQPDYEYMEQYIKNMMLKKYTAYFEYCNVKHCTN